MSGSGAAKALWCCSTCGAVYHKDYPRCPNDGGEVVVSDTDPLLGKTLGHYVIDHFVGEGGMGRVYDAHHASLPNKRYAVKVLLGDAGATPSMRKRFAKEAESASRLVHPNVVGVIDYGSTAGGLPYIVMDFVDGRSLADLIDEGPMQPARVVRIVRAVCEGLAYAHDAGVVHRDLKPANIIMTGDAVPRIADFGLAQTLDDGDVRLTSTGMAMGTPAYAAPEQMAGKRVNHRADLYALGMTMFEMCSGGELPFKGGPLEVATAKAHREAPPFHEICPGITIPSGLEALIASLMRRRAHERPGSCAEVLAALDAMTSELAAMSQRTNTDDRGTAPSGTARVRARRTWHLPAAVATLALAGGVAWFASRPDRAPAKVAEAAPVPARSETPTPVDKAPGETPTPVEKAPDPPPADPPPVAKAPDPPAEPPVAKAPPPRHRKHHEERPRHAPVAVVTPAAGSAAPVTPPVASPPPPPPPPPAVLHAAITGVDVHGSLPAADVRRAVDRTLGAIERCAPTAAQTVVADLTIGESRRPQGVRASGGTAAGCVGAALGGVRTESAPDVGEVEVTVHVRFAEQK